MGHPFTRSRPSSRWQRWRGLARSLAVYYGNPLKLRRMQRFYGQFIEPGDLCFDIGAHVGNRVFAWSRLGARIVAVEPQPACLAILRRLYGGARGVTLVDQAVGAAPGRQTLRISRAHPTVTTLSQRWIEAVGASTGFAGVAWEEEIGVEVTTLDALIARFGPPAFCKIDIEGYEGEALAGLTQPLRALSFEFVPGQGRCLGLPGAAGGAGRVRVQLVAGGAAPLAGGGVAGRGPDGGVLAGFGGRRPFGRHLCTPAAGPQSIEGLYNVVDDQDGQRPLQRYSPVIREQKQELTTLRRQWPLVAACYGAALLGGYNLLRQSVDPQQSLQWLMFSATAMAVQLGILWWALPYNRRQGHSLRAGEGASLLPTLGYANAITLLRGLCTCMLAGFLLAPQPEGRLAWMPAVLYTVERLVDFVDGYVARVTRSETKLGEILDIEFDGLGILIAILLGMQYGKLPPWYLLLGFGRQLFVLGMWLLRRAGKPVYELPPSEHRRMIAGFQTGFITVVLWPLWPPAVTLPAAYVMAVPLVFSFGRDWLVVSGVVDAASEGYRRARAWGKLVIEGWLPLGAPRLCSAARAAYPLASGAGVCALAGGQQGDGG